MTQKEFEKLSKQEQRFRWALFIDSNGYEKTLSTKRINGLKEKYLINKKPLPKSYVRGIV